MFTKINISNYKSILDLKMQLGEFTLLIGANGCGKSNILEAITMAAAASAQKLDFEYFANRGMRVVQPELMYPAFKDAMAENIEIQLWKADNSSLQFEIHYNTDSKPPRWDNKSDLTLAPIVVETKSKGRKLTDAEFNFILLDAVKKFRPKKEIPLTYEDVERIKNNLI